MRKRVWKFGGSGSENSRPKKRRTWARGFIKAKNKKMSSIRRIVSSFPPHASNHTASPSSANASTVSIFETLHQCFPTFSRRPPLNIQKTVTFIVKFFITTIIKTNMLGNVMFFLIFLQIRKCLVIPWCMVHYPSGGCNPPVGKHCSTLLHIPRQYPFYSSF